MKRSLRFSLGLANKDKLPESIRGQSIKRVYLRSFSNHIILFCLIVINNVLRDKFSKYLNPGAETKEKAKNLS